MKKSIILFLVLFCQLVFINCDDNKKPKVNDSEISETTLEGETDEYQKELEDQAENQETDESTDGNVNTNETEKISYQNYSYPKIVSETEIKKDFLDRTNRSDCKIYKIKFSDGVEGTLVDRSGDWFSYSIWGKKREKLFASKEDGIQKIWEEGTNLRNVGGAIGGGLAGQKKVPLKKDGTPDMRYSVNK